MRKRTLVLDREVLTQNMPEGNAPLGGTLPDSEWDCVTLIVEIIKSITPHLSRAPAASCANCGTAESACGTIRPAAC
jgi:hypothetical protein